MTTLCLDAPFVALAWQELYARTTFSEIHWHHRILIFIAVWLGYAADRWLDARRHRLNKTHRHKFFSRNRGKTLIVWFLVLIGSVTYALFRLSPNEFVTGVTIAVAGAGLTFLVQTLRGPAKPQMKSLSTALLVLLSACLFTVFTKDSFSSDVHLAMLSTFLLYLGNCMAIQRWDHPIDRIQEGDTHLNVSKLGFRLYLIALTQLALGAYLYSEDSPFVSMPFAALISLSIMYPLDTYGEKLFPLTRRLLADVSLLSPFLLLPF